MTVDLRRRWPTALLTAIVTAVLATGAACGGAGRTVPGISPVATPTPENGRIAGEDIAATYLVHALRPALGEGGIGRLGSQAWEPVAPAQAERLMALLPEQAPGLMQVFEGSFRAQDQGSETLVTVRVFARVFTENPADLGAVVFTVAAQPQGNEAKALQEWQGYGLLPEGLAALAKVMGSALQEMGVQVRQVSELDTRHIGEASMGLRMQLASEGEEVTIDMAAARRNGIVLVAGGMMFAGAQALDVVGILTEMDRRAQGY
jgi:hypothetical protein